MLPFHNQHQCCGTGSNNRKALARFLTKHSSLAERAEGWAAGARAPAGGAAAASDGGVAVLHIPAPREVLQILGNALRSTKPCFYAHVPL